MSDIIVQRCCEIFCLQIFKTLSDRTFLYAPFFGSPSSTAKNLNGPLNTKSCLGMLHESARTGNIQLNRKVLRFIEENFINVVNNNGEVFYCRVCVNVFETLLESEASNKK